MEYLHEGSSQAVISEELAGTLLDNLLQQLSQRGPLRRVLLLPPDITRYHSWAGELTCLLYQRLYGTRTVCLRLTNTYGPRQLIQHNRQGFIPWFIRQAVEGGCIELYGEGRQRRDMNYVDDVVEALLLAGASEAAEGEVYNLGGDEYVSLAELAEELISLTGRGTVRTVPFPQERLPKE